MKDSKFIELLNLYVDHQISAGDAALLEAEIQKQPERRRIYRQYCQMQKACAVLAENFRTQAPATTKVVEFPRPRRRLIAATYAMGLAAAAACVALVMVNRQPADLRDAAPASTPQIAAVPAAKPAMARVALQPAFAGLVRDEATTSASLASADGTSFDWMTRVQLQRVPLDQLRFETHPTLQPEDLLLRSRPSLRAQTEMTAFRFQK